MNKVKSIFVKCKNWFVAGKNKLISFFNRFNLINGWKKGLGAKQSDKFAIEIRISKLTLIDMRIDFNKEFRLIIFNIGLHFK